MIQFKLADGFNIKEILYFLDRGYDDCMHYVQDDLVFKLVNIKGEIELLAIGQEGNQLGIETIIGAKIEHKDIIEYVKDWFDLERDIEPFHHLLTKNTPYDSLLQFKDLRLVNIPDIFETLCWSIIGQQINLSFAFKLKRNLVELCGKSYDYAGRKYWLFPSPKDILKVSKEELLDLQFSRQKADYVLGLAQSFVDGNISKEMVQNLNSHQEQLAFLKSFRGIGEWTAQYTLMKCLKNMEAIPFGDSGINQAFFNFKNFPKKDSRALQEKEFEKFDGWQNYFAFYLWRSLA